MSTAILTTKLYTPPLRPEVVSRSRLTERLAAGLHRKLSLVSAPAGFGKTTLLAECAATCGQPLAWLSLDQGDNDPVRFWTYFVAALQTIPSLQRAGTGDATLAVLQAPGIGSDGAPLSIPSLLTGLINELADLSDRFLLVLDDLHLITQPQIHEGLVFLLDNAPPHPQGLHLIVASRSDPPWPLARLRARGEMTELRVEDLRFRHEEAVTFLRAVVGLELPVDTVAALDRRTEGWIAGLQMAAISMRERSRALPGRPLPQVDPALSGFVEAFTGSHRFILDYLIEEVLNLQEPAVQDFLLKTSILERMTAPLCDAVTGRHDSHAILTGLERANLFLNPLDHERRWYRYHRLFADLLRIRLEQTLPGQIPDLHRRASQWCEEHGLIAEAITHATAAGDLELVARLVEGNALATLYVGQLATVANWLDALPDEVVRSRPWLSITLAWLQATSGQWEDVQSLLQDVERSIGPDLDGGEIEARHLKGYVMAIRTYNAAIQGDMPRISELARQTLDLTPRQDWIVRSFVTTLLGASLRHRGDLEGASQAWTEALLGSRAAGDSQSSVLLFNSLAQIQIERGQLDRAAATCRDMLEAADEFVRQGGRRLPIVAPAYARLSTLHREWNDLEGALRHAQECLALCEPWGHAEALTTGYSVLARALQANGDEKGALEAMQKAVQLAGQLSPWYRDRILAEEAKLRMGQGDLRAASRWLQDREEELHGELAFDRIPVYVSLARALILSGRHKQALNVLAQVLEMLVASGSMGSALEVMALQALALHAQGEVNQALDALEPALTLGEREGFLRSFLDEGEPMAELLLAAVAHGVAADYAGRLLAALEADTADDRLGARERDVIAARRTAPAIGHPHVTTPPQDSLVEPLSERELQVLRLLTTSLPTPRIADELVISVSTVRSHIKNIYGKLGAHSRLEAVERAHELELL